MINLIFDIDDTLYDQLKPFEDAFKKVFNCYTDIACEDLYVKSRKYSDEVFHLTEDGSLKLEDMHIYRISKAFLEFGYRITSDDARSFQKEYSLNQEKITVSEGMRDVLKFGKDKNLIMGIITNGPLIHQSKKVKVLGLNNWIDEDKIFISERINLSKPDINIFKFVENRMNLNPKYTYYIGDSLKNDVVGAKRAGWKVIWINRRNYTIPTNFEFYPDYIIKDDKELIVLLSELLNKMISV